MKLDEFIGIKKLGIRLFLFCDADDVKAMANSGLSF